MADEGIQAFGTVFRTVKARDREVIIDADGLINYTTMMRDITGNRYSFRDICRDNRSLYAHVLHHDRKKLEAWASKELARTKKSSTGGNPPVEEINEFLSEIRTIEIEGLVNAGILVVRKGGPTSTSSYRGTYGPRYLLDFLLFNVDVVYYDAVHETMEALDAFAQKTNKSLVQELEELRSLYDFKTKELNDEKNSHDKTKA